MKISSINNEKVVFWAKLKMKKYRDIEHLFIVESPHLVEEAIKKGIVEEIITSEEYESDYPTYHVTNEIMKRISSLISPPSVMAVCRHIVPNDIEGNVLLLDKIQDPGNLGTIIRSAVAFNFDIVIGDNSVDIYNSKTIRSTEGMIFNVNFIKSNLVYFINNHKDYKYLIADMNNGTDIKKYNKQNKVAIIMGNEGNGISDNIRDLDIDYIYIKQSSKCESLNVGVAASILMHELGDINE